MEKLLSAFALSFIVNWLLGRRRILRVGFAGVDGALLAQKRRN